MYPHSFEYIKAESVENAIDLLTQNEDSRIIAGGQSLVPMLKSRLYQPAMLIDIGYIKELRSVSLDDEKRLHIGAMVTHSEVIENSLIRKNSPLLSTTAENIGDIQIRNRGTIGGSVCECDPSADYLPSLIALDASVVLQKKDGKRELKVEDFLVGPYQTAIEEGEVLIEIIVPSNVSAYRVEKYARRKADFAIALVSAIISKNADGKVTAARIVVGALQEKPERLSDLEDRIVEKSPSFSELKTLARESVSKLEPIEDLLGSSEYRRHVIEKMIVRLVGELVSKKVSQ